MSTPEQIKSCCTAAYSSDAVSLLLGESYHPGGAALTRRLADLLDLTAGQRVVDVAAGPGATAQLLATEYGVTVDGVDLAAPLVESARVNADDAGLAAVVRYHIGDAERLPFPDNTFDALVTECAFCTFPDKTRAAAEFARVLRPAAKLGLSDVTVADRWLPDELTTVAAWVACIADARPLTHYINILNDAGLHTQHCETHNGALLRMIDRIEARVQLARMTRHQALVATGIDADAVANYIEIARRAVTDGLLGYALLIAEKH
jgi:SAM-dependent methyltransferase